MATFSKNKNVTPHSLQFNNSLSENGKKVNTKKSLDVNHYMTAAENGDEETARYA